MMRYWTTTTTLYCYAPRCGRQTRQVVECRIEGDRLVKKTTCYRCGHVTKTTGPAPIPDPMPHNLQTSTKGR